MKEKRILDIKDLSISFETLRGKVEAIRNISFHLNVGETLGIVGESGCGKSVTSLGLMGLLPKTATMNAHKIDFLDQNLLTMSESDKNDLRGKDISMIFQDPMTSLNPSYTVGFQIMETIKAHYGGSKKELEEKALDLLNEVGIPAPKERMNSYPHELSGGMSQRVMIAQAISCCPKLLIADEPTTALDVTIQSQILDLLLKLKEEHKMSLIFITHDIGVVANISDRLQVMYAGEVVETGPTKAIIHDPAHPYTEALFKSLPSFQNREGKGKKTKLYSLPGLVPDLVHRPQGCQLSPRCPYKKEQCFEDVELRKLQNFNTNREVKCVSPLTTTH